MLPRKGDQVETGERSSPHGVDVAQRIGGTYLTKHKGIVYRWRYKVSRNDDSLFVVEPIYPGIVAGFKANQ